MIQEGFTKFYKKLQTLQMPSKKELQNVTKYSLRRCYKMLRNITKKVLQIVTKCHLRRCYKMLQNIT